MIATINNIIPIYSDLTPADHPLVTGQGFGSKGLVPRDPVAQRVGYSASIPPAKIETYSVEDITRIARELATAKANISSIIKRSLPDGGCPPSLDQNGQGYCANYGIIGAHMAVRAKHHLPYVRLSGHANAWRLKGGRDQGGWGAEYLDKLIEWGCPDVEHWKEKSMSSANNVAATWENAKLYATGESFADLASAVYDRNMSLAQVRTCLVDLNPTVSDRNRWSHCTFDCDVVDGASQRAFCRGEDGKLLDLATFDAVWAMGDPVLAGLGMLGRNSWSDSYGDRGFFLMTGNAQASDNAVALCSAAA